MRGIKAARITLKIENDWDDKTITAHESTLKAIYNDSKAYLVVLEGAYGVGEMFALKGEQILGRGLSSHVRLRGEATVRMVIFTSIKIHYLKMAAL